MSGARASGFARKLCAIAAKLYRDPSQNLGQQQAIEARGHLMFLPLSHSQEHLGLHGIYTLK